MLLNGRASVPLCRSPSQLVLPLSPQLAFLLGSLSTVRNVGNNHEAEGRLRTNRLPGHRSLSGVSKLTNTVARGEEEPTECQ